MAAKQLKLMTFAYLGESWAPCGQLTMTEEGPELLASSFAYGLNYLNRSDALEVDPVSLSIHGPESIKGKLLLPVNNLASFGGIRDAAPDAWGRRVIEAKLKVLANSLPESQYLLHAGSERVGALDIRSHITGTVHALEYLMQAAERIEAGEGVPANLEYIFVAGSGLGGTRPKASVAAERYLHLGIGPQGRLATLDNALGGCEMFSLSLSRACELVGEVWRVVREWKVLFERAGVSVDDIVKVASAFRHLDSLSTAGIRKLLP